MQRTSFFVIASLLSACANDTVDDSAPEPIGDSTGETTEMDPSTPPTEAPPPPPPESASVPLIGKQTPPERDAQLQLTADVASIHIEGENMAAGVASGVYPSPAAVYGNYQVRIVFANGDIAQWFYASEAGWRGVSIAAQGSHCVNGWPTMQPFIYNQAQNAWTWWANPSTITSQLAGDGPRYFPYFFGSTYVSPGWNYLLIRMGNDSATSSCDANLAVDYAEIW